MKDKKPLIITANAVFVLQTLFLRAFHAPLQLCVAVLFLSAGYMLFSLFQGWLPKRRFYRQLTDCLAALEQKYILTEIVPTPDFYEGQLIYEIIYEMGKSMTENVARYRGSLSDFKEYLEIWVHEAKLPITQMLLAEYNGEDRRSYIGQLRRLDEYTERVLYYLRSEVAEKDFLIRQTSLRKTFKNAVIKMRDEILSAGISIGTEGEDGLVMTDGKWLEFIVGQFLSNSIKYMSPDRPGIIRLSIDNTEESVRLRLWDNGIGIPESDMPNVFRKSFTGENGRKRERSTGMGLYIAKQLCDKLGHELNIDSKQGRYTEVSIVFARNKYYEMS